MSQCPYYRGISNDRGAHGIYCGERTTLCMGDENVKAYQDARCIGSSERDKCRPYLFRRCKELGLEPQSDMDNGTLQKMYFDKICESGAAPKKENESVEQKCGECQIGHWYSGEYDYTRVVQEDGINTIKRPCKPHTHYCCNFAEGQREVAGDASFNPGAAPDWCPLRADEEMREEYQKRKQEREKSILQSIANEEENSVDNTPEQDLENAESVTEVSTRRQYAEKLHNSIMHNAEMTVNYLMELSENLKRMRDDKLYIELGYDTFEDYVEKDVGIKQRQAYTYISTYEKLGPTFMQTNARLGITRLSLLTEVPAADRPDFAEDNDLAGLSTREIKELIEKAKNQGEQLSFLTGERDNAKASAENAEQVAQDAREQLDAAKKARENAEARAAALAAENEKLKSAEPDAAALEKIKKDAEKVAKKEFSDKLKTAEEKAAAKAKQEAQAAIKAAREEGEKAAAARIKANLEATEQEKAAAMKRVEDLEKQLKVSSDQDTVQFAFLFDELQQNFNKLCGIIKKVDAADREKADKFRKAMTALTEKQCNDISAI